jgi:hypothetical protein
MQLLRKWIDFQQLRKNEIGHVHFNQIVGPFELPNHDTVFLMS